MKNAIHLLNNMLTTFGCKIWLDEMMPFEKCIYL